jgi:cation diffusion facilitator family transporter
LPERTGGQPAIKLEARMPKRPSSLKSIYAALLGNLLVALTKAAAAFTTGSSAMTSEALHSFVDSGNEVLLLYGQHRAARRPDAIHPLGYGRELYFWSFIVALLIFALGSGISVYQGVLQIIRPRPMHDPVVNYVVLALAFVFEGGSWVVSIRQFRAQEARSEQGLYESFRRSKDPPSFMVLFEDSAALLGILIAAAGTYVATYAHMPIFDGIASVLIGLVLGGVAILLARESKSLLIGEAASHEMRESIRSIAAQDSAVSRVNGMLSAQLAPDQILVAMSLEFEDNLCVPQIEERVMEIERKVRETHPEVMSLFIKPQTPKNYRRAVRRHFGQDSLGQG